MAILRFRQLLPHEPRLWVETWVTDPHFAPLFTPEEVEIAKARVAVLHEAHIA